MNLKNQVCYFCGDKAESREHIPPELIFVGFPCNKIRVPACNLHNNSKSGRDDAIIKGFLLALQKFEEGGLKKGLNPTTKQAIEQAKEHFHQVKKVVKPVEMFFPGEDPSKRGLIAAFMDNQIDLDGWIKMVTAGLIWDSTKEFHPELDWVEGCHVLDNFFLIRPNPQEPRMTLDEMKSFDSERREWIPKVESFPWVDGWSSYPNPYPHDLYNFRIWYSKETGLLWFYHTFFAHFRFWLCISASEELATRIVTFKMERNMKRLMDEIKAEVFKEHTRNLPPPHSGAQNIPQ